MTKRQSLEDKRMSVAATTERIVRETMIERGLKKPEARKLVAREAGVRPGALERLANGSLVHVERITERMNAYAVKRLTSKISEFSHQLDVARLAAVRPDDPDILRAAAALEDAKRALKGK